MAANKQAATRRDWNKWLTASVGVVSVVGGLVQFYYKEILLPAMVPVNMAADLEVKPLKTDAKTIKDIIPVMIQVKISNPAGQSIYLNSPIWKAFGIYRREVPRDSGSFSIPTVPDSFKEWCGMKDYSKDYAEEVFVMCLNQKLAPLSSGGYQQFFADRIELPAAPPRHGKSDQWRERELIAIGPLTKERELKPGVEIREQILIPVSTKPGYDYLELMFSIPSVSGVGPDEADKIATVKYINYQEPSAKAPQNSNPSESSSPRLYQMLQGFCLTRVMQPSLVDRLKAFKLPRRNDEGTRISLDEKNAGVCYNAKMVPAGTFLERIQQFVRHVLREDHLNRFGAKFYDSTFEVPLQLPEENASTSKQAENP
jgi:hypothetical protein